MSDSYTCASCHGQTFFSTTEQDHHAAFHQPECSLVLADGSHIQLLRNRVTGHFACPLPACGEPGYSTRYSEALKHHFALCSSTSSVSVAQSPVASPSHARQSPIHAAQLRHQHAPPAAQLQPQPQIQSPLQRQQPQHQLSSAFDVQRPQPAPQVQQTQLQSQACSSDWQEQVPLPDFAALFALHLSYDATVNVLVCTLCGIALDLKLVEEHWRTAWHEESGSYRHRSCMHSSQALSHALGDVRPLAPSSALKPKPTTQPIPYLEIVFQAFQCTRCDFVARSMSTIALHWNTQHPTVLRPALPRSQFLAQKCSVQRWSPTSPFFQVGASRDVVSLPAHVEAEQNIEQPAFLQQLQPSPAAESIESAWEERKRTFAFNLRSGNRAKLGALAWPAFSASEKAVQDTVLRILCAGCNVLPNVPLHVLRRIVRLDNDVHGSFVPFCAVYEDGLLACATVWGRITLFLLRAYEQCGSEAQARPDGLLPAWSLLASMPTDTLANIPKLAAADAATRQAALLNVSAFFIQQPLLGDAQQSALVLGFTCLCASNSDEWYPLAYTLNVIDALAYCSRMLSLLLHLRDWRQWSTGSLTLTTAYEDCSFRSDAWDAFEARRAATLLLTSSTALPYLAAFAAFPFREAPRAVQVRDAAAAGLVTGVAHASDTFDVAPREPSHHGAGTADRAAHARTESVSSISLQELVEAALNPQLFDAALEPQCQNLASSFSRQLPDAMPEAARPSGSANQSESTPQIGESNKAGGVGEPIAPEIVLQGPTDTSAVDAAPLAAAIMDPRQWIRKAHIGQRSAQPVLPSAVPVISSGATVPHSGPDAPPRTSESAIAGLPTVTSTPANRQSESGKKRKRAWRAQSSGDSTDDESEADELEEDPGAYAAALLAQAQPGSRALPSPKTARVRAKRKRTLLPIDSDEEDDVDLPGVDSLWRKS